MPALEYDWQNAFRPVTLIESPRLNERAGVPILLASETFQCTGSFKFRAAYHTACSVPQQHILTASSGNFGQAMAWACRLLKKSCLVVMPHRSAQVKIQAVKAFGATVDLIDVRRIGRLERLRQLAELHPEAYVASAYDDPLVIEGNASLGRELAAYHDRYDVVVAPVGGGGLASGLWTGLRGEGCQAPLIGAEPVLANDAARSLRAGKLVALEAEPDTLADGVRTLSLGQHNWRILQTGLDRVLEVSEEGIAQAVRLLFDLANLKAEPTGALALAAVLEHPTQFGDRRVCCVVSGGNVDPELFARLIV